MSDYVARAGEAGRDAVLSDARQFVLGADMTTDQLSTTARICLASGYRRDEMTPAIAGAMTLVALGEKPYAELLGHHLSKGFGTPERADLAQDWYAMAVDALDGGATPVFAPEQANRGTLLHQATMALSGGQASGGPAPVSTQGEPLPVFQVSQ